VLEYRILGPLEVFDGSGVVELGGPKQRSTLAILLLNANRVVSIDRLADDLYGGAAPVTALKQVQRQISDLRRLLGRESTIETRSPGYVIRLAPEQLDLTMFERLSARAMDAAEPSLAAALLRQALDLWRGPPLADLAYESFAHGPIERLEEIRLAALEERIECDLRLGRHAELTAELEQLVAEHPLRERLSAQLMLALYRAGRQADALEAYRRARNVLVGDFGLEPTPGLQQLERRILAQDPTLGPQSRRESAEEPDRTILVVPDDDASLDELLALAMPLSQEPGRELIVARPVRRADDIEAAQSAVAERRMRFASPMRVAAFTSANPAPDILRLADAYDAELVLLDSPVDALIERSTADLAVAVGTSVDWSKGSGVFVPFGGGEYEWAALELAAWLASAVDVTLPLVGVGADPASGRRDASRLLANASVAVQRLVGIDAMSVFAEASADALADALAPATLVVLGMPRRPATGRTALRDVVVEKIAMPTLLLYAGSRPGGLAPRDVRTRFSWSLEG
jgi:DNA-binding SARP family transcriptional activator